MPARVALHVCCILGHIRFLPQHAIMAWLRKSGCMTAESGRGVLILNSQMFYSVRVCVCTRLSSKFVSSLALWRSFWRAQQDAPSCGELRGRSHVTEEQQEKVSLAKLARLWSDKEGTELDSQECVAAQPPSPCPCVAVRVLCWAQAALSGCHSPITAGWFKYSGEYGPGTGLQARCILVKAVCPWAVTRQRGTVTV